MYIYACTQCIPQPELYLPFHVDTIQMSECQGSSGCENSTALLKMLNKILLVRHMRLDY